jgi:hypothetical protein
VHNVSLALQAAWKVLLIGVILGAGLPALFATGVRSLAYGQGGDAERHAGSAGPSVHPAGKVLAGICFAVVLVAVGLGITYIVVTGFGKVLSFEHVFPAIVDKKK